VTFPKNEFRRALLKWYRKQGRDLPWRRTRNPYAILVSEFMLQQTQVATVLGYYSKWLQRFPSFRALSRRSETEVLHAWQGLGYYARVRNLQATAKLVVQQHRGRFPRAINQMQEFPGVGKYTAHAVATFAFDQPVPIIEVNTARVLSRLFNLRVRIDTAEGRSRLWNRAAILVPRKSSSTYNSALLDLGALVCLPHEPKCDICPLKKFCHAENPALLPIKQAHLPTQRLVERHAFITRNGKLLLTQAANRWRGMWMLPQFKLDRLKRSTLPRSMYTSVFPFTNHRVALQIFRQRAHRIDGQGQRWFSKHQLDSIPIPSPHRRAIEQLIANA
jgi:A/G-specific adenine glycosylase